MEHIEQAAESAADRTIQASTAPNRYADHFGNVSNDESQPAGRFSMHNMMGAAMNRTRAMNGWNGLGSQGKYIDAVYGASTNSHKKATLHRHLCQPRRRLIGNDSILETMLAWAYPTSQADFTWAPRQSHESLLPEAYPA